MKASRYYILIIGLSLLVGITNNLISSEEKSVGWFSGQKVLKKPADPEESQSIEFPPVLETVADSMPAPPDSSPPAPVDSAEGNTND